MRTDALVELWCRISWIATSSANLCALVSWFSPDPYNVFFQFLYRITEPVLSVVRAAMPNLGGIDISPIIVLLAVEFLKGFLVKSLVQLAYTF